MVQKCNVFKKDPELGYELIDEGSGDAKPTINRVNTSLTKAYRTLRAVKVAHKMLAVAKADAAAVKTKPDAATLAGIGIAALSVADLTLNAIDDAKGLVPELQGMSSEVTNRPPAQPLWPSTSRRVLAAHRRQQRPHRAARGRRRRLE